MDYHALAEQLMDLHVLLHQSPAGRQLEDLEARIAAGDNRKELVRRYTNLEHLTREIVEVLIDYILVGKRKPGEADPPVEIHWNF